MERATNPPSILAPFRADRDSRGRASFSARRASGGAIAGLAVIIVSRRRVARANADPGPDRRGRAKRRVASGR